MEDEGKLEWKSWTKVYLEDVNRIQSFDLPADEVHGGIQSIRLVFEDSSDFFGRITVYDLQVLGQKLT